MYYNNTQKFTVNSKGYLPEFLYSGWKLTLLSVIVFTVAGTTTASASILPNLEQDISTSQQSSFPVENDYSRTKQSLVSSTTQLKTRKLENTALVKRLKAKRASSSLTKRLRSIRNNQILPNIAYEDKIGKGIDSVDLIDLVNLGDLNKGVSRTVTPDMKAPIIQNENRSSFTLPSIAQAQETSTPEVDKVINELRSVKDTEIQPFYSPGLSIYVPTGFGGDRNRGFISTSYQPRGRFSNDDDLGLGIGVGLGDSRQSVGVELSYTLASFGRNREFGSGGFNVKVHRQLPSDLAFAVGWNGFLNIGDENNFQQSLYGVATKIIKTQDSIDKPFSRVALTVGIGTGQFRTESAVFDNNYNVNVFGSVAVRVARPASLIVEWTGQDLGVGVSVAPFPNLPLVITPAVRDITGAGDGARFVLGTGFSFQF